MNKGIKGRWLSFDENSKGHCVFHSNKVAIERNVLFFNSDNSRIAGEDYRRENNDFENFKTRNDDVFEDSEHNDKYSNRYRETSDTRNFQESRNIDRNRNIRNNESDRRQDTGINGDTKKKQLGGLCIICCWRLDDVIILHQGGWESMAEAGLDG